MNEKQWVSSFVKRLEESLQLEFPTIKAVNGYRLPYASEILSYDASNASQQNFIAYETDILIFEQLSETKWKPRIIIETKIISVTTHDAITYSQKAKTHKYVHPYLRYGILLGKRGNDPLPGRLFRHGVHFDFMLSWKDFVADHDEWNKLIEILKIEIEASRTLDEIIYNSRSKSRKRFTSLHRPLKLDS